MSCATANAAVVALLFAGFESAVDEVTVAVFDVLVPGAPAWVTIVIVAEAPLASVPSEQTTVDVPLQLPCDGVAEVKVTPAGSASVTTTLLAGEGPLFVTLIVNVAGEPVGTGFVGPVFVIARSATAGLTVVMTVDVLFAAFGSEVVEAIVAELVMTVPVGVAGGIDTTSEKTADWPAPNVAIVHVTVTLDAGPHVKTGPLVCPKEMTATPAGRLSVSETLWASEGPALFAVIV